jgi:hypothetical protein
MGHHRMRRRLLTAAVALLACAIALCGGFLLWCQWSRAHGRNMPDVLLAQRTLRRWLVDDDFMSLVAALRASPDATFATTWDGGRNVALSRTLFEPREMYGQPRYVYRPGIGVSYVVVWSGLFFQGLTMADEDRTLRPAVTAALDRCDTVLRVHFTLDTHGFKPTTPAAADAPSMLFLGDSFTEGLWTPPEDTFVGRFARRLAAERIPAAVFNLGVDGYGALEMAWSLDRYAQELNARIAIAGVFPNDVDTDYPSVVRGEAAPGAWLQFFTQIEHLRDRCRAGGIRLVVLAIPSREQFDTLLGHDDFQSRLSAWCRENGLTCLDPREDIQRAGAGSVYLPWDPHFSMEGHRVVAEFLWRSTAAIVSDTFAEPRGG